MMVISKDVSMETVNEIHRQFHYNIVYADHDPLIYFTTLFNVFKNIFVHRQMFLHENVTFIFEYLVNDLFRKDHANFSNIFTICSNKE